MDSLFVNKGAYVQTSHVQNAVNIYMIVVALVIFFFLIVHLCIRSHYKAKTEYAVSQVNKKKKSQMSKTTSPFSLQSEDKKPTATVAPAQYAIEMSPEQLEPIINFIALGNPPKPGLTNPHIQLYTEK